MTTADARALAGAALSDAMRASRERTFELVDDLDDWRVPQQAGVNPLAWELAHLAWFAEFWILRGPHRLGDDGRVHASLAPRHAGPDEILDSSRLAHAARWTAALPGRREVRPMLDAQLDACLAALPRQDAGDAAHYFHRLALLHEDMHAEALIALRATLSHPAPSGLLLKPLPARSTLRYVETETRIGWPDDRAGFAFDNEAASHVVRLAAFEIDAEPVRNIDFVAFVEDGGYHKAALWTGHAADWHAQRRPRHPERWRLGRNGWEQRWFERWQPLPPDAPVVHLSAHEAEAYCLWAARRLPSAAEWEHAALGSAPVATSVLRYGPPPAFRWGQMVWEWTADPFLPYPGFQCGPYRDYSAPWFGAHRELRGGSVATSARLHDARYRNFFEPGRCDLFAGFRTTSLP